MNINDFINGINTNITNNTVPKGITEEIVGNAFTDLATIVSGLTENTGTTVDLSNYYTTGQTVYLFQEKGNFVSASTLNNYLPSSGMTDYLTVSGASASYLPLSSGATIEGQIGNIQAGLTFIDNILTGGTAGQVLAKFDNANYNLHWVTPASGSTGSGSYVAKDFNEIIFFDTNFKMSTTQSDNISFILGSGNIADVDARITIIGDGVHTCTFPNDWVNANGVTFDNTVKNIIYLEYDGVEVLYGIVKIQIPDTTAPTLVAATVEDNARGVVKLQYSELLDETVILATTEFSVNLSKSVIAVTVKGSTVLITVNSTYLNSDVPTVSYSPGANKIQDVAGNAASALTNHSVTNNIAATNNSVSITSSNQILRSAYQPSQLYFGNNGAAGTDTPMSVSLWVKPTSYASTAGLVGLQSATHAASSGFAVDLLSGGGVQLGIFDDIADTNGNPGIIGIYTGSLLVLNSWNHIICTYNGNKQNSGEKIYVNGTLATVSTSNNSTYKGQNQIQTDTQLAVFTRAYANTPNTEVMIDCLYLWNKELTSGDVTNLYNSGASIDPTTLSIASNLTARYEFDGNLLDKGAYSYNLTSSVAPTYNTDHP